MRSERATAGVTGQSDEYDNPLLSVCDLEKYYPVSGGLFSRSTLHARVVDGVSFNACPGEMSAVVGEPGCGKMTLGKTIMRLYESIGGSTSSDSRETTNLDGQTLHAPRRDIQAVYQDPSPSLNPRRRIGDITKEPLIAHDVGTSTDRDEYVADLPERVDLPVDFRHRYSNTLSGGQ